MKKIFLSLATLLLFAAPIWAQEFEIRSYDVKANVNQSAYAVEVQAKLRLINLSGKELVDKILLSNTDKPKLSFFLNPKATVTAFSVNGAAVKSSSTQDRYLPLQKVAIEITSSIASQPEFDVEIAYSVPSPDRSATLHVSSTDGFALPNNFWIPVVHTPYADHGADTAPFKLTVTAPGKVISSGNVQGNAFDQTLAGQPFFFFGDYDVTIATAAKNSAVEIYAQRGLDANGKEQAKRLAEETAKILSFYTEYFDMPHIGAFRVVSTSARNLTFSEPGAVAIDESFFRRNVVDLGTIELIAAAAAKSFIDGRVLMRGRGAGLMRDGLPLYFTAQYLGSRFGAAQREAAFERYRRSYEPIARGTDTPLIQLSSYDRSYTSVMYSKGALVWRLLEKKLSKPTFDALVRKMLDRQAVDVLTVTEWKAPLCRFARCTNLKAALITNTGARKNEFQDFVTQWIENLIVPDFAIGQPQAKDNGIESTIVNFGSGDMAVDIVATTESGELIKKNIALKSGDYSAITFPPGTKITRIEVDPEKIYPQKDYSNDVFPRKTSASELYGQARLALIKKDFVNAEAKMREALSADANSATLLAYLGQVLLEAGKTDEAGQQFIAALKVVPIQLQSYTTANLGLGDLAMKRNDFAAAATYYRYAATGDIESAITTKGEVSPLMRARDGLIKAEQSAGAIKNSDEVKAYLKQLDDALLQGTAEGVNALVEQGNLREFVKRVTASKPTVWATEILRTENWDADQIAVDANVKIKILGKEGTGRVLYVLHRSNGKLKLSEVPVFDVK